MKLPQIKVNKKKVTYITASGVFIAMLLILLLAGINAFFNLHYFVFQPPIIINIQAPILLKDRELLSPIATQSAMVATVVLAAEPTQAPLKGSRTDAIFDVIHYNESNYGKAPAGHHMDCRARGKVNEWGWFPGGDRDFCFNSFEEGAITIKQWITKRINLGWSNSKILCFYNTGNQINTCAYALGNLSDAN